MAVIAAVAAPSAPSSAKMLQPHGTFSVTPVSSPPLCPPSPHGSCLSVNNAFLHTSYNCHTVMNGMELSQGSLMTSVITLSTARHRSQVSALVLPATPCASIPNCGRSLSERVQNCMPSAGVPIMQFPSRRKGAVPLSFLKSSFAKISLSRRVHSSLGSTPRLAGGLGSGCAVDGKLCTECRAQALYSLWKLEQDKKEEDKEREKEEKQEMVAEQGVVRSYGMRGGGWRYSAGGAYFASETALGHGGRLRPGYSSSCRFRHGIAFPEGPVSCRGRGIMVAGAAADDSAVVAESRLGQVKEAVHLIASLGLFLSLDKLLKKAFLNAGIRFPSALFGMFCIFASLITLDAVVPKVPALVVGFFSPANLFIQRWLPLFYVPSLVMLPLAIQGIPAAAGAKIMLILTVGWVCSLAFTGQTAMLIRKVVNTELLPTEPMLKPPPFTQKELKAWITAGVLSFVMAVATPVALGSRATTALPFLLSSTVVGYLVGLQLSDGIKKVLHPIISCALAADFGVYALGLANGGGFYATLGLYLTKSATVGAGDVLMGFLGSVILSFAFSIFTQRKLINHHAAEIFTAVISGALFSLYFTALVGRLLALNPLLTRAIIPRCVTVALALPIANLLEGSNPSLTAAAVVLTGLVGANFTQSFMNRFGFHDPISRGMATACSAHGLGTAALAGKEPEALPFCAIAYALAGICSSVLCAVPVVRESLMVLAGTAVV